METREDRVSFGRLGAPVKEIKLEVGKDYQTRAGLRAKIYAKDSIYPNIVHGVVQFPSGDFLPSIWRLDGKSYGLVYFTIIKEHERAQAPFTGWMCQVGAQVPMPSPNEQIAREWAKRGNGRAFRVVEVLE